MELKFSRPLLHPYAHTVHRCYKKETLLLSGYCSTFTLVYANIDFLCRFVYRIKLTTYTRLKRFIQRRKYLVNYYVPFIGTLVGTTMCFHAFASLYVCCVEKHRNSHLITLH